MAEQNPNYFREALTTPGNMVALCMILMLSMASGFVGGAPLMIFVALALLGGDVLGNLLRASSVTFQHQINRRNAAEQREKTRAFLLDKLRRGPDIFNDYHDPVRSVFDSVMDSLVKSEDPGHSALWWDEVSPYHQPYHMMVSHLDSLREMARNRGTSLTPHDIDKLDEVTLDYLRLVYAYWNLQDRMSRKEQATLQDEIFEIETTLGGPVDPSTRRQLMKSLDKLKASQKKQEAYPAKATALSARLRVMSHDFEELYHKLHSDPSASNVSDFLSDMTEKLSIEEELSFAAEEVEAELSNVSSVQDLDAYRRSQAAQAAKNQR